MAGRAENDDELITDINVTPLVDIILVLLIILMVTASYIVSNSIPMELPDAENHQDIDRRDSFSVTINADRQLYIDADEVTWEQLGARARAFAAAHPDGPRAIIAADRSVTHGDFIRIVDILRGAQITRYAINVNPQDIEGSDD